MTNTQSHHIARAIVANEYKGETLVVHGYDDGGLPGAVFVKETKRGLESAAKEAGVFLAMGVDRVVIFRKPRGCGKGETVVEFGNVKKLRAKAVFVVGKDYTVGTRNLYRVYKREPGNDDNGNYDIVSFALVSRAEDYMPQTFRATVYNTQGRCKVPCDEFLHFSERTGNATVSFGACAINEVEAE